MINLNIIKMSMIKVRDYCIFLNKEEENKNQEKYHWDLN